MSTPFYDLASLVVVPSGYKASKVYAQKPLTTDGQLAFTRSTGASRVASNGLIEKVRTNLLLWSENFDNATWVKIGTTVTVNDAVSPDGSTNADALVENTATSLHDTYQAFVSSSSTAYTFSCYIKPSTRTRAYLRSDTSAGTARTLFDLTGSGSVVTLNHTSASISLVGNGWYRCSITFTEGTGAAGRLLFVEGAVGTSVSYAGNGLTAFWIYGAQLEVSDFGATDYIATTSAAVSVGPVANVPRLDYLNSSCPRLLLEPQRTNNLTFSESFDNAAWTKGAVSVTANNAVSPDGYSNADLITADGTTAQHYVLQTQTQSAKTISVFAKMGSQRYLQILTSGTTAALANCDLQTGAVGGLGAASTASMVDYGNGWWRIILTSTDALTGSIYFCFASSLSAPRFEAFSSTGTLWLWGAMAENGATYATSYIPTLGAAVTRGADSASKTGISSLIGQTQGTIYYEFNRFGIQNGSVIVVSDNNQNLGNRIEIRSIFNTLNGLRVQVFANSTVVVDNSASMASLVTTTKTKIAIAYSATNVTIYVNGVQRLTQSVSLSFSAALQAIYLANRQDGGQEDAQNVNQALLFKTRLTNAQLAELTTL